MFTEKEIDMMIWANAQSYGWSDEKLLRLRSKLHYLDKTKTYSTLITLALPNDTELAPLIRKLKGLDYKYLSKYVFSLEYFSKTGENLHVHMFLPYSVAKAKCIRDFSRKFRIKENFIDIRKRDTEDGAVFAESYVRGIKKDAEKAEFVQQDEEWRKANEIEKFYEINF